MDKILCLVALLVLSACGPEIINVSGGVPDRKPEPAVAGFEVISSKQVGDGIIPFAFGYNGGFCQIWWKAQLDAVADPSFTLKCGAGETVAVAMEVNINFLSMGGGDKPWLISMTESNETIWQSPTAPSKVVEDADYQSAYAMRVRGGDYTAFSRRSADGVEHFFFCDLTNGCASPIELGVIPPSFLAVNGEQKQSSTYIPVAAMDDRGNLMVGLSIYRLNSPFNLAYISALITRKSNGEVKFHRLTGIPSVPGLVAQPYQSVGDIVPVFDGFALLVNGDSSVRHNSMVYVVSPEVELKALHPIVDGLYPASLAVFKGSVLLARGRAGDTGLGLSVFDARTLELLQDEVVDPGMYMLSTPSVVVAPSPTLKKDVVVIVANPCLGACMADEDYDIYNVLLALPDGI